MMLPREPLAAVMALAVTACAPTVSPASVADLAPTFTLEVVSADAPVKDTSGAGAGETPRPTPPATQSTSSTAPSAAPTPSPTPTAAPAAPSAGGGDAGGGSDPNTTTGQVYALGTPADLPLAGARVATTDGRSAFSAADGSFVLPGGPPGNGVYVVSRENYATLVMTGQTQGSPRLYLQAQAGHTADPPAQVRFTVHGRLIDPDGRPVVDAFVALGDADGTTCVPVVSGVNGAFDLPVTAPTATVANGTLIAAARTGNYLALQSGVSVSADQPTLAPLAMVAADHAMNVALDSTVMGAIAVPQSIDLVAADGTRLGIALHPGSARIANIPGARYAYRAEAVDPASGTTSMLVRDNLPIDFTSQKSDFTASLLAPPQLTVPPTLTPGEQVSWPTVAGADGYHLSLTGTDSAGFVWEGLTSSNSLPLTLPAPLPAGHYDMVLAALDGAAQMPRSLMDSASRPVSGPGYRKATRRVHVSN